MTAGRLHPRGLPDRLVVDRTLVMGVLNVTPDSFSDGGAYLDHEAAVERGRQLCAEGADVVDVGGESTRPGAQRVTVEEELRRVIPVVRDLAAEQVFVSIDTMRARVAAAAVEAGAGMVNDVSGGLADPDMAALVATSGLPYVVMHWRGHSRDMGDRAVYSDVVGDVVTELAQRLDELVGAGVDVEQTIVDPGIGFAKKAEHNWPLLARLDLLHGLGRPVLVGASRKSFLGQTLADGMGPRPPEGRDVASAVLSGWLAMGGAWAVRVHAVRPTVDALRVVAALRAAGAPA